MGWWKRAKKQAKAIEKKTRTTVADVEKEAGRAGSRLGNAAQRVKASAGGVASALAGAQDALNRVADEAARRTDGLTPPSVLALARQAAANARQAADLAAGLAADVKRAAATPTPARAFLKGLVAMTDRAAEEANEVAEDAADLAEDVAAEVARSAGVAVDWMGERLTEAREWLVGNIASLVMDEPNYLKEGTHLPGDPVYYVNGIWTSPHEAREEARALVATLRRPVWVVYNPSTEHDGSRFPFADDLLEAVYDRTWPLHFGGVLASLIQGAVTTLGGDPKTLQLNPATRQLTHLLYHADRKISIVSHSQGCLITRNANFTAALFRGPEWAKRDLAWVATGAPLGMDEVWPKPEKLTRRVNPGDFVAQIVGFQGGAGTIDKANVGVHNFVPHYSDHITASMLHP